jgi:hypothetical protein
VSTDLPILADQVRKLSAPEKLHLAAGLLDRGLHELARSVTQLALDEIDLAILTRNHRRRAVAS